MDLTGHEFLTLAEKLLPAISAAGALELRYQRQGVTVERKGDSSPVTIADREAEALIIEVLGSAAPGVPVVGEESVAAGFVPTLGERFFLVDALDGTKSFVRGDADFTVNVALVERRTPIFGIVYAPASRRLFMTLARNVAIEAELVADQATVGLKDLQMRQIATRRADPADLAAVASRSHNTAETEALLARWGVKQRRDIGSSLKFCLVARGEADIYPRLGAISEWDTAAGHAVLSAAGGCVTTLDGRDLEYGNLENMFKNQYFIAWGNRDLATRMT